MKMKYTQANKQKWSETAWVTKASATYTMPASPAVWIMTQSKLSNREEKIGKITIFHFLWNVFIFLFSFFSSWCLLSFFPLFLRGSDCLLPCCFHGANCHFLCILRGAYCHFFPLFFSRCRLSFFKFSSLCWSSFPCFVNCSDCHFFLVFFMVLIVIFFLVFFVMLIVFFFRLIILTSIFVVIVVLVLKVLFHFISMSVVFFKCTWIGQIKPRRCFNNMTSSICSGFVLFLGFIIW